MNYRIYKLQFKTGLHVGRGKLTDGAASFYADTLFSALCKEALKLGGEKMLAQLVERVQGGQIRLSDGFPYIANRLYIPKPMLLIKGAEESDSKEKKAYKKMEYIPLDQFEIYLQGKMDVRKETNYFGENFGTYGVRAMAKVEKGKDAEPYSVGVYYFKEGAGLYVIVGFEEEEDSWLLGDLFESLSYTGIGGKRSSGLGKFVLNVSSMDDKLEAGLNHTSEGACYMALSLCLPSEKELDKAIENARYGMLKRSGFISSESYAATFRKKRTLFTFKAGSCFKKTFDGIVADVSEGGNHPVYCYAKAMLMEIG